MLGAGLVAKNIIKRGLNVPPHVKTTLTLGSKVVKKYLEDSGLMPYLEGLGFHFIGFGCTTCIGNSGPLNPEIEKAILENDLNTVSVLSGNRNFEARIHPTIKANYIMSPMLVLAFAVAGRIDIDLTREPLGIDPNGEPVFLKDIWPTTKEIKDLTTKYVNVECFKKEYDKIFYGDEWWMTLPAMESTTYPWDEQSTYIKEPPYFKNFKPELIPPLDIKNAKMLLSLGDSVTN